MKRWWVLSVVLIVVTLAVLLACRTKRLTADVWTVELPGRCALDYHPSIGALALACPGVDYTRLWPWPVVRPWEESGPVGTMRGWST